MRQFITNMLNIQEDKIEELQTIAQSDGTVNSFAQISSDILAEV